MTDGAMPILVTGGAGFIGSHTCKALAGHGFEPIAFDNLSTGNKRSVKWGPLVEGNILDTELLKTTIKRHRPEAIVHFAASAYVGESAANPAKYYRNNVAGLLSLLDAALHNKLKSLVFSSSCATYGVPSELPIDEGSEQNPVSVYGRTKLFGEAILADYSAGYGLRHVILRYFNASGADPDREIGEWHEPETHLIPLALMAAAGTGPELCVFGSDYDTPDGTCIRDYVHVSDLARAHVLALRHLLNGGENLAVNLGSGAGYSVAEILETVRKATGRTVPHKVGPRRAGDPPALYACCSLARKALGFEPEISDLDAIIRSAAPFFGATCDARPSQQLPNRCEASAPKGSRNSRRRPASRRPVSAALPASSPTRSPG